MITAILVGFALGAAAIVAQLELAREFLALSGGSEVALGLTLGAWLVGGGLGSLAAGRMRRFLWPGAAAAFLVFAALYVLGLWLTWGGRELLGAAPGELLGWLRSFAFALAAVAPASFFGAAAFALLAAASGRPKAVYVAEAAGACVAGLLFTVALSRWLAPLAAAAVLFAGAAACGVAAVAKAERFGRWAGAAVVAAAAVVGIILAVQSRDLAARWFFARSFPGEKVVAYRTSPYGAVAVTARAGRYAVYQNGLLAASFPDEAGAEETVMPAMLLRPAAGRVVLFGGGLGGALGQFDKFGAVREVTYVELDREMVEAARVTFNAGLRSTGRLSVVGEDGRLWARRAAAAGYRADVVIVAMPTPASAQVNRFYTREFFADAKRLLAPDGVLAFGAPGAANYYPPTLAAFLAGERRTAAAAFGRVAYLPGERFIFLCSDGPLDASAPAYARALERTGVRNLYLTPAYFKYRLTADRLAAASRALAAPAPVNADFKPAGLYYGLALAAARAGGAELKVLGAARRVKLWYIFALAAVAVAPWFFRRRLGARGAAAFAVTVQGFVQLALELLVVFCYQAVYGAAYLELALIVGAFMAGLGVGGAWPRRGGSDLAALTWAMGCAAALAVALPFVARMLAQWSAAPPACVHLTFGVLAFAAGACGGVAFVAALRSWGGRGVGALYGLDLLGAAASAVVTSVILIPVLGIGQASAAVAVVAAAATVALAAVPRRARAGG